MLGYVSENPAKQTSSLFAQYLKNNKKCYNIIQKMTVVEPEQVHNLMSASHQKKLQAHLIIETINPVFI